MICLSKYARKRRRIQNMGLGRNVSTREKGINKDGRKKESKKERKQQGKKEKKKERKKETKKFVKII